MVLKYKHSVFQSGRLYTDHLRFALAVLHGEDAGDSLYEDIMGLAGQRSRDLVKSFITKAMGAYSREAAHNSWNRDALGTSNFREIEAATMTRFPMLKLYAGRRHHVRGLESCCG